MWSTSCTCTWTSRWSALPRLSELHQNIQDAFNEAGVQIMSPHFRSQPEQPVVVPRDRWGD
jgi:hypothetical protein